MRRRKAKKIAILPDPKFNDVRSDEVCKQLDVFR